MIRCIAALIGILATATLVPAATIDVEIHHFTFNPSTVNIQVGDSVRWTNMDFIGHTATSQTGPGTLIPSGVFDSGDLNFGDSFTFTFTSPGTFHYWCVPHGSSMQGVVVVAAPPEPCPGDANGDRAINGADLSVLLAQFNTAVAAGTGADFNEDAIVNGADLSVLLGAFGDICP